MTGLLARLAVVRRFRARAGRPGVRRTLALTHALAVRPERVAWQPEAAKIEITTRCNIHCAFCHLAAAEGGAARAGHWMPADRFRRILDDLPRLRWLDVQGVGEPLAHPGFFELLAEVRARGVRIELTTNGLLLGPEARAGLLDLAYRVTISLPAARPETFAALTGAGGLDRVIRNARALAAARVGDVPTLRVSHVPLAPTLAEAPEIVDHVAAIGADQLLVGRYQPGPEDDPLVPEPGALAAAVARLRERAAARGLAIVVNDLPLAGSGPSAPERCHWPWSVPMIDVQGELRPCCYAPRGPKLGNLADAPFSALWNGPAMRGFRADLAAGRLTGLPCATCKENP